MLRLLLRLAPLVVLLAGCGTAPQRSASFAPPVPAQAIVFVLDGAGGHQNAPRAVVGAVSAKGLPIEVRSFDWGQGLGLSDVIDVARSRQQGERLAAEVCRVRRERPGVPVSLLAYSAGSAVALVAAEQLPPDTIERVVLLAPAISAGYDLRPALRSARVGVDVFTSDRDRFWLGTGTAIVGNADGRRGPAAGRVGFCPPADGCLADRLRQHPWEPSLAWSGHSGGHGGSLKLCYLQAYVLPLFAPVTRTPSTSAE